MFNFFKVEERIGEGIRGGKRGENDINVPKMSIITEWEEVERTEEEGRRGNMEQREVTREEFSWGWEVWS